MEPGIVLRSVLEIVGSVGTLMTLNYEQWNLTKPISYEKFMHLVRMEFCRLMIRHKMYIQVIWGFNALCNLSYKIDSNLYCLGVQVVIKVL